MKTAEKVILIGAAGIAAFVFYSKARALADLVVTPGPINDMGFQDATPVASVTVLAQNTSSTGILINSFAGNVFSNDILIGNAFSFSPVLIPGNSQTPVVINIQFKALGIVSDLINAFQSNNFSQNIKVAGYANVSGWQLPLNLDFRFGSPYNPPR